jgi:cytoskeletal protein CcmA (bactofilin family)
VIGFKRVVRIDGIIEGNVQAATLILGKTGSIKGEVSAEKLR